MTRLEALEKIKAQLLEMLRVFASSASQAKVDELLDLLNDVNTKIEQEKSKHL
jgi:ABC-type microcin C transport system duplicated ATPase subunit YejF